MGEGAQARVSMRESSDTHQSRQVYILVRREDVCT